MQFLTVVFYMDMELLNPSVGWLMNLRKKRTNQDFFFIFNLFFKITTHNIDDISTLEEENIGVLCKVD